MFKMKKLAAVAAAAVMAVSAMAVSVSAAKSDSSASIQSVQSNWTISSNSTSGVVSGLVQGSDTGVTFRCTSYYNPTANAYEARCTVTNSILCLNQGEGVNLSYANDYGTVLFINDWYRYSNGGNAPYRVEARNAVYGSGQYISGYAR